MKNVLGSLGLVLGLLLAGSPAGVLAQQGPPEFEVDAVSMRDQDGTTRLDLYTRIPYANLSFINTANGFTADYEIAVDIFELDARNRRGPLVLTDRWESDAVVNAFFLTQAYNTFDHTTQAVTLAPGRYLLVFQLTDQNAGEVYVREMPVEVRNLTGPVAMSDLLLIEDYDEERNTIFPRVSARVPSDQFVFQVFHETYIDQRRELRLTREIWPIQKRGSALVRAGRTLLGLGGDEEVEQKPVYTSEETVRFTPGRHQVVSQIPLDDVAVGDYLVRIRLSDANGAAVFSETERTFSLIWSGLADHLSNLDDAIDQLRYIAKKKELEQMKQSASFNERMRQFQTFWQKRDPTPGTLRNESMEEYYYRIDFANKNYGSMVPGWKTDRGQVLVSFGRPDFVEQHRNDYNTEPYEIWWYYRIGRRYIFIDKTGFGDYELLVPIWDDRNRIR